ncbi:hypothetical protein ACIRQQ_16500 [Streptomyces fuscichromogenes]|uniref:hypothetical protein n=1 Tax=Streptomyces fuscichromogenes TaxID=1324013 RepID=UPI003824C702
MKSERPENDDDAAAGNPGEPPEDGRTTESPKAAEAAESTVKATPEPKDPPTAKPVATPEPEPAPEPNRAPTASAPRTPEPAAEPEAEAELEAAADAKAEAATEPEAEAQATAEPQADINAAAEPQVAAEAEAAAEPEAEGAANAKAGAEPEAEAAAESEAAAHVDADAATAPEAKVAAEPEVAGADALEVAASVRAGEVEVEGGVGRFSSGRRSGALVVVSVAAAVLLIGGGGAYLAASSGGTGTGAGTGTGTAGGATPPPLALDGYSSGGNGIAPGEPDPYGVTYRASGTLPAGPRSATVYQPSGEVSKDQVAALAKSLGIEGTPVAEGQVWKVGTDSDGSGGSLQVNRTAPGIWTYSRYAPGTDNCKRGLVCAQDPVAPAGDPVSVADAEKAAAPVLKALGQDATKLDASQVMGAQRVVNAAPVVGGLPTYGWATGLTVSKQGEVVGGNGMLATPAKGDTYPVLSAAKTLDLMNAAPRSDHRMGIGGCASAVPLKDRLEQPCGASTPSASSAVIEKAVFGLAAQSVAGRQALVPSWLFQVRGAADSYTVAYPAVDPAYLVAASAAATAPASTPSPSASAKDVKVDGYTTDDRELVVAFTGGVCADYKVTADESSAQVVVKVTATPWPDKICVMIAKQYHQAVRLDAPLDGRKVVGTDGRAVPKEKATALNPQLG